MTSRLWPRSAAFAAVVVCAPAFAQEMVEDPVVLRVDGTEFHRSDLEAARAALPEQYREMPLELLYDPLIDQLVNGKLLLDKAKEAGVEDTPGFQERLAQVRDQLARQAYLEAEVDAAITEDELDKAYVAYLAANPPEEEVRASHILVATEDEAKAVIARLEAGEDFAALARTTSTDPSAAQNGGDLGFFRRADMVPEFSEAAFALRPGATSTPVRTAFGWHVIRLAERRTTEPPARGEVDQALRAQIANEVIARLIRDLRAHAVIERFNPDGSPRIEPVAE
jgi:peptidyl-prolyl cis-trans isomerase C